MKRFLMILLAAAFLTGCQASEPGAAADLLLGTVEVQANDDSSQARYSLNSGARLSSFSTKYNTGNKNRTHNILLASETISGTVLRPGEEFSFNKTLGSTGKDNGYKKATVYSGGAKAKNYGGGVCQVSSTLFNAAEAAGMEITERHSHSLNVDYVEKGRDATTSHNGKLDLKFKNPYHVPVVIHISNDNGTLSAEIHVM